MPHLWQCWFLNPPHYKETPKLHPMDISKLHPKLHPIEISLTQDLLMVNSVLVCLSVFNASEFFFSFLFCLPCAMWSSPSRTRSELQSWPLPQLQQQQILNPLCRTRDQSCPPGLPRHCRSHFATGGTSHFNSRKMIVLGVKGYLLSALGGYHSSVFWLPL